jgi:hypothetical protein
LKVEVQTDSPAFFIKEGSRVRELIKSIGYAVVLVWVNAYICREMFVRYTPHMNSMQGFWIAMARLPGASWFHSNWWRYWDGGSPVEFIYSPLIPAMAAWTAAVRGVPHDVAFQTVSGFIYCLGPLTLFLLAWLWTRAPGYAFAAALLYSLTAPSQLILPDGEFSIRHFWDARRFYLMTVWDETPHMAALAILPLVILFLSLSIRRRRPVYYIATIFAIAACALASDFGPVLTAMAALCLLFVLRRQDYLRNIFLTAGIGLFSWAICSPFLSPTGIAAIRAASADYWNAGSFTALAIVAVGWALIWHYLPRWTPDWRLQFFALFAWLTCSVPIIFIWLNRQFLPQPGRYKVEMELSLALLLVFALRSLFARVPRPVRFCLLFLLIALASEQIIDERRYAKVTLAPADVTRTIEYRASVWARDHLSSGVRVMMPGTIAEWANAFTDIQQLAGGSFSVAYNQVQQRAKTAMFHGGDTPEKDAEVSITWLKAFGAGAIGVSGPKSQEYWKPFGHPTKFDGRLEALWSEDDVTIYRVPLGTESLAHVVPESALVRRAPSAPGDTGDVERYVAALDDASLPAAEFEWQGENRIHIRTTVGPGQAISVQVTHHPGWHAKANGAARQIKADGLGLMWIQPGCSGACDLELQYDGGAELRICHMLSIAALVALIVFGVGSAKKGGRRPFEKGV